MAAISRESKSGERALWSFGACSLRRHRPGSFFLHFKCQSSNRFNIFFQERIYSSDQSGQLFVWTREEDKEDEFAKDEKDEKALRRSKEKGLIRKLDFGERGAIDCIQVHGSQVFTSFDDFGSIVINDFW